MKKYYLRIGLCALLAFMNSCQKTDNQENNANKNTQTSAPSLTNPSPNSDEVATAKEQKGFITKNGALYLPPENEKGKIVQSTPTPFAKLTASTVFEAIEPTESEIFSVQNEEPQTLELAQGTKIYVPDNAFVLAETGELVTGEVKIETKEVRNVMECLKMGVTTMSNAGLLESGGMLYVAATYEGKKCKLGEGKELAVEMPSWGEQKEGMKLFSGEKNEEGKIVWKENVDNQISSQKPENYWQSYCEACSNYQAHVDSIEDFIIHKQKTLEDVKFNFDDVVFKIFPNEGITKTDNLTAPKRYFQFTGRPISRLTKKQGQYEVVKDTCHLYVNISKINKMGDVVDWKVMKNTNPIYSAQITEKNIFFSRLSSMLKTQKWEKTGTVELAVYLPKKLLPKFKKTFPNLANVESYRKKYRAEYDALYHDVSEGNKERKEKYDPELCQKYATLMREEQARRQKMANISAYAFKTSRLGWINCDRFTQEPKTQMAFNLGEFQEANVTFVYKKIHSLMMHDLYSSRKQKELGRTNTIKNLPQNHAIVLFVVKRVNDKMYFALKQTNTSEKVQKDFDFQELTEEKLAEITKRFGAV